MKRYPMIALPVLISFSIASCGDDESSGDDAVTAATTGPNATVPSATGTNGPAAPGSTMTGNGGGGSDPASTPGNTPANTPGASGAGNTPVDDGIPDTECPASQPAEAGACDVSFTVDCAYDTVTCNCIGFGGDQGWQCDESSGNAEPEDNPFGMNPFGMGMGFGGSDSDPEPEPEPVEPEPTDCPDGGMCEGPVTDTDSGVFPQGSDGGPPVEPEPMNPETCPEEAPPDNVCDSDAVGFATECRYGNALCTCGGFPGAGEWMCVEDAPMEPEPMEPEPMEPEPMPTDAGVEPPIEPEVVPDAG